MSEICLQFVIRNLKFVIGIKAATSFDETFFALYQLSYALNFSKAVGLEPTTSSLVMM